MVGMHTKLLYVLLLSILTQNVFVTGFWKTDRIVTLGLFHFMAQLMATLIHYTFTLPLSGLVDWSAFLEQLLPTL